MLKKLKKTYLSILLSLLIFPYSVLAYSDHIIVGGSNIGIEINTNGIIVVGFYDIDGINPGKNANLVIGDIIIKIDNINISTIKEMIGIINSKTNPQLEITYIRDNKEYTTSLDLVESDSKYKSGLYVKDTISGIGTLTYIDPNTKIFGALGH